MPFSFVKKTVVVVGLIATAGCSTMQTGEQSEELRLLLGEIRAREQVLDKRQKLLESRGRLLASLELQQESVAAELGAESVVQDIVALGGDMLSAPIAQTGECFRLAPLPPRLTAEPQKIVVQDAADQVLVTPPSFGYTPQDVTVDYELLDPTLTPPLMQEKELSIETRPAYQSWEPIPAQFELKTEPHLAVAAHQTFQACAESAEPALLAQHWCAKPVAAEYQEVERKVVTELSAVREVTVPAERLTLAVREPQNPADKTKLRAVVRQIAVTRIENPASYRREVLLPEFKTVTVKQLTRPASLVWRQVVCADELDKSLIEAVQVALNERGYEVGEADGEWGAKTEQAMQRFRADKALPDLGQDLGTELLRQLGVATPE